MTKQHFIALADKIRDVNSYTREGEMDVFTPEAIRELANFCASQNPRFNRQRWMDYIDGKCGQNGGMVSSYARR